VLREIKVPKTYAAGDWIKLRMEQFPHFLLFLKYYDDKIKDEMGGARRTQGGDET
jgi:hypothetical protein